MRALPVGLLEFRAISLDRLSVGTEAARARRKDRRNEARRHGNLPGYGDVLYNAAQSAFDDSMGDAAGERLSIRNGS
jgi:hypothetical protein